jgi:hypothetical protein
MITDGTLPLDSLDQAPGGLSLLHGLGNISLPPQSQVVRLRKVLLVLEQAVVHKPWQFFPVPLEEYMELASRDTPDDHGS